MVNKNKLGWLYWLIAASFFAYEWMHKVSPGVLTFALREDLNFNSHQLGILGAMYFYAYAAFQLPAGMLTDKFGPKVMLAFASGAVAFGSYLFTNAVNESLFNFSRLIIGAGSAFAFISCLRIGSQWLSSNSFPFIVGLTNLFGTLGALFGGQPLSHFVYHYGWRETFFWITLAGIIIFLMVLLVIPRKKSLYVRPLDTRNHNYWYGFMLVVKNKQSWILACYGALVVAPIAAIPELWGIEFLKKAYSVNTDIASSMTHTIFIGTALGGPIIGLLASKFKELSLMRLSSTVACILLVLFLYVPMKQHLVIYLVAFLFGLLSANMLLCFSLMNHSFPPTTQGVAIGFVNMLIMIVAGLVQQLVGVLLDFQALQHQGFIELTDYHTALGVLPLALIAAVCLTAFMKPLQNA